MSLKSLALWAAAALALACAIAAPAQTLTTFPLRGSDGANYPECAYSDGSKLYMCHLLYGWTGSAPKAWTMDANGYGGVNVFSSVLPAGAATAANQATAQTSFNAMVAALQTPTAAPTAANIAPAQSSVTSTAASLVAARTGRRSVTIENTGTTPVYIGGAGVTSTTGFLLPGVAGASVTINFSGAVYAVTATGTAAVTLYEIY